MKTPSRLLAALFFLAGVSAYAQPTGQPPDVLLQGFYWNVHPGDHWQNNDGLWWDSLRTSAPDLAAAGFQTVWIPSPAKGAGGRFSMGYDLYDYYDFGAVDQKFTRRTRFGTVEEFEAMMGAFDANGLRTMMDVVLNHRDGADAQSGVACGGSNVRYNYFDTGSGRFGADALSFHPNPTHCDTNAPFHDNIFGQDVCYFHQTDNTLAPGAPNGGWHHGPHSLGFVGDSLVVWGRWLMEEVGIDEVRVDAVKHIEPGFLAPWLAELTAGPQPFAVGEFFGGGGEIRAYHDDVERFNSAYGGGGRDAQMAMFDFDLRFTLKSMCDGGGFFDMRALNTAGLLFNGLDPFSVVTFAENHDFDRIGFVSAGCNEPGAIRFGATCTKLGQDYGHDPVLTRKNLAYAYMMAAEGRPSVFWKDYRWFGLGEEIEWLMALRRLTAQGASVPMAGLNPNPELDQSDLWALRRWGFGEPRFGMVLAINDNGSAEKGGWLDTPHASYELRDYSDAYLFQTTEAFSDGRAFIKAPPSSYAWFAPTGLYPRPMDEPASRFTLEAEPGGKLHYVALRAADAASFVVNGAPIQPGDEVAILGPSGVAVAGLGRVGQRLRWDGQHDVLIEVLGNAGSTNAAGRLQPGDPLRLVVYDQSTGTTAEAATLTWAPAGQSFTFDPHRPASRGGAFSIEANTGGTYVVGGISRVVAFDAGDATGAPVAVTAAPQSPPVEVGPSGGSFVFDLTMQSLTGAAQTVDVWTDVLLPNGAPYGPVIGPSPVALPASGSVTQTISQSVPSNAPAGGYVYRAHLGTYPDAVATSTFSFSKSAGRAASVGGAEAWASIDPTTGEAPTFAAPQPLASRAGEAGLTELLFEPMYPNPFAGQATLRFAVPEARPVRVEVFDGLGRRVRTLYDGTPEAGAVQAVTLDGAALPSGVYLVRLVGEGVSASQTVVRLR